MIGGPLPTKEALIIELEENKELTDDEFDGIGETLSELDIEDTDEEWLLDRTEKFCQDKAIYNAIRESISILDDSEKKQDKGAIPEILTNTLAISLDKHIGHDFLEDAEARFEYYHTKEHKIPLCVE